MENKLFNTPFELSLHVIMLLDVVGAEISVDRIVAYDFIAVYADTFGIADISLNGENEFAFGELAVRRKLIKAAIKDLVVNGLILVKEDESGVRYCISKTGKQTSNDLQSTYAKRYKEIMALVTRKFCREDDVKLFKRINKQSMNSLRR